MREWIDCGEGMLHDSRGMCIPTRVVEQKDFGRIFEVYDYSNEPEANFRLLLNAPKLQAVLEGIMQGVGDGCDCLENAPAGHCMFCTARAVLADIRGDNEESCEVT